MLYILVIVMSGYGRLLMVMSGIVIILIGLQGSLEADISELMFIIPWFWSYLGSFF